MADVKQPNGRAPLTEYFRIEFARGAMITLLPLTTGAKEFGRLDRVKGRPHAGGIDLYEIDGAPIPGDMVITVAWGNIKQAWRKADL